MLSFFFFFNDTATTEIYTLSLHDALPICFLLEIKRIRKVVLLVAGGDCSRRGGQAHHKGSADRKSTRLNSSHLVISYAVFCLKKKKQNSSRHPLLYTLHSRPTIPDYFDAT